MSVDVEKLRRVKAFLASEEYDWTLEIAALDSALTELEQLREENRELNHVIAQNQATYRANTEELRAEVKLLKDCCADWEEHHAVQVKAIGKRDAALAALVDAFPKCDCTWGGKPCGKPATHYELSAWGGDCPCPDVDARCDEHNERFEEADWSTPLRAALRLLGRATETAESKT